MARRQNIGLMRMTNFPAETLAIEESEASFRGAAVDAAQTVIVHVAFLAAGLRGAIVTAQAHRDGSETHRADVATEVLVILENATVLGVIVKAARALNVSGLNCRRIFK